MSIHHPMTPLKRTSLNVYDPDIFNCSQQTGPPAETSPDTDLFRLICERVEANDPGAKAIAWMIPGATDNKFYGRLGAQCYGFVPVKLEPHLPFGSLFHGNDERLPIEGFYWGLKVYAEVVLNFIGVKFDDVFA